MPDDSRIKAHAWEVFYRIYYQEFMSLGLARQYRLWERSSAWLRFATISASVVAGSGALYFAKADWKDYWTVVALIATLVSLHNAMFSIAERLAEQSNLYGQFSSLRTKLESFLRLAKNVGVQDIAAAAILLKECEDKFDDVMSRTKRELLHTEGYRLKIKRKLNARLAEDDWGDLERKLS